jgi:hypothetical protein
MGDLTYIASLSDLDLEGASKAPDVQTKDKQPRSVRNANPGNIEDGPFAKGQPGYAGSDGRFAKFESPDAGRNAQVALLDSYAKRGFDTVEKVVGRWAPPGENDTGAYIRTVAGKLGVDPREKVQDIGALADAMAEVEGGPGSSRAGLRRIAAQRTPSTYQMTYIPSGKELSAPSEPAEGPKPESEQGDFSRGAEVAWKQNQPMIGGVAGFAGAAGEKIFGEGGFSSALKKWGSGQVEEGNKKLEQLSRPSDDISFALEKLKEGDASPIIDNIQYNLGYMGAQVAESVAVALAGAGIGMAVGGPPGAAAGGAEGLAASLGHGLIGKLASKEALRMAEKQLGNEAGEIAIKQAAKGFEAAAAKRVAGAIGAGTTSTIYNLGMESGQIYPMAEEQAKKEGRELTGSDLWNAMSWSVGSAGSETLTDVISIAAILGRIGIPGVGGKVARALTAGAINSFVQGGQEGLQTWMEWKGAGREPKGVEFAKDFLNSAWGPVPFSFLTGLPVGYMHAQKAGSVRQPGTAQTPPPDDGTKLIPETPSSLQMGGPSGGIREGPIPRKTEAEVAAEQMYAERDAVEAARRDMSGQGPQPPADAGGGGGGVVMTNPDLSRDNSYLSGDNSLPVMPGTQERDLGAISEDSDRAKLAKLRERQMGAIQYSGRDAELSAAEDEARIESLPEMPGTQEEDISGIAQDRANVERGGALSPLQAAYQRAQAKKELKSENQQVQAEKARRIASGRPVFDLAERARNAMARFAALSAPVAPVGQDGQVGQQPVAEFAEPAESAPVAQPQQEAAPQQDAVAPVLNQATNVVEDATASPETDSSPVSQASITDHKASITQRKAIFESEVMESRSPPEVSAPMATKSVKFTTYQMSGPKDVSAKLYELPGYKGPQLAVYKYKTQRGDGYRVYLPKSGELVEDNNGVSPLNDVLKLAVQRIQKMRQKIGDRAAPAPAAQTPAVPNAEQPAAPPVTESQVPDKAKALETGDAGVASGQEAAGPQAPDDVGKRIAAAKASGISLSQADEVEIRRASTEASDLRRKADRTGAASSDPLNKGTAFPMGVGFTRETKRGNQRIDASVRKAGEAVELYKKAEVAEKYVASLLSGTGTEADKLRKDGKRTEFRRKLIESLVNWKKGDKLGGFTIERVNADRDGYPASYTISGDGIIKGVSDKVDVAREFFGRDKDAFRSMVDDVRAATAPAAEQQPQGAGNGLQETPEAAEAVELKNIEVTRRTFETDANGNRRELEGVKESADKALADVDQQISAIRALIECLNS